MKPIKFFNDEGKIRYKLIWVDFKEEVNV